MGKRKFSTIEKYSGKVHRFNYSREETHRAFASYLHPEEPTGFFSDLVNLDT